MSFWDLADGTSATKGAAEYEVESNNFAALPDGSRVLAVADSVSWKYNENGNDEHIRVKWTIHEPEEFQNRRVSQALWVTDDNPQKTGDKIKAKRDADKRQLAKFDACCGGKLAMVARKPTDDDLTLALTGKMVVIELGLMESERGDFNWVRNIYPRAAKAIHIPDAPAAKLKSEANAKKTEPSKSFADDLDDDVPF